MGNKKIVVAEDDYDIRKALILNLTDRGYEVVGASNGQEALELILKNTPDLLITDFEMPGISGVGLINELGKKGYKFPVIINSGMVEDIDKKTIRYNGKLRFRSKSSPISKLYEKLKEFLD